MKVVPKTAELANQLAWWHNFTFKFLQNFKTKNPDLVSKWCHATTCFYFLKIKNFFERQIVFKFWIEICRKRPTTTFHFQHFLNLRFAFCFRLNSWRKGREPWYSGYGRRLMFQRSWVRIPAPHTRWTFSHLFVVKVLMFVWKDKNKWKRSREWTIFINIWTTSRIRIGALAQAKVTSWN